MVTKKIITEKELSENRDAQNYRITINLGKKLYDLLVIDADKEYIPVVTRARVIIAKYLQETDIKE